MQTIFPECDEVTPPGIDSAEPAFLEAPFLKSPALEPITLEPITPEPIRTRSPAVEAHYEEFLGMTAVVASHAMRRFFSVTSKVARSNYPVLITGRERNGQGTDRQSGPSLFQTGQ